MHLETTVYFMRCLGAGRGSDQEKEAAWERRERGIKGLAASMQYVHLTVPIFLINSFFSYFLRGLCSMSVLKGLNATTGNNHRITEL